MSRCDLYRFREFGQEITDNCVDLLVENSRVECYTKKVYLCLTFWFAVQIRKD